MRKHALAEKHVTSDKTKIATKADNQNENQIRSITQPSRERFSKILEQRSRQNTIGMRINFLDRFEMSVLKLEELTSDKRFQ